MTMKTFAMGTFLGVVAFFQVVSTVLADEPPFTACSSTGCLGVFGSIFILSLFLGIKICFGDEHANNISMLNNKMKFLCIVK